MHEIHFWLKEDVSRVMGQNPRTTLGEHNSLITIKTIQKQFESLKLCHICASARIKEVFFTQSFFPSFVWEVEQNA